ncbi:MAG TPA: nicotinate (nicotinamide) nucleotide adenylyltransferase [Terriglobales bacterium]|nr:nicotinate (nicotinamide) nucleotide adenylyltransferase [Terriglobales bacterium]
MNIALFGGTFDPIHIGHLAVARAAVASFYLDEVQFVVTELPPHKSAQDLLPFHHRFAMVELALEGERKFLASRIEQRDEAAEALPSYSIDTVRRVKKGLSHKDNLFFIVGMDSFLNLKNWRDPQGLLAECEFIVVTRPGHELADIKSALPDPALSSKVHLLDSVAVNVSSTEIRKMVAQSRSIQDLVPPAVANYIHEHGIYRKGM